MVALVKGPLFYFLQSGKEIIKEEDKEKFQ